MPLEFLYRCADRAWQIIIVRVEPRHNFTLRVRKTFIDRFRLALVFFAYPPRKATGILMNNIQAAIRRATVHDEIFDIPIILFEDRTDRPFQEGRLIEGWSDNGNEGHFKRCKLYSIYPSPCAATVYPLKI